MAFRWVILSISSSRTPSKFKASVGALDKRPNAVGLGRNVRGVRVDLLTEWADVANADHLSISVAQVSAREVAEAAVAGMVSGKRSVVPGLVPKAVGIGGRFTPRTVLLPALRTIRALRK
jgi:hypothetical protein